MKICINSRDLTDCQRGLVEDYFEDNFSFEGNRPTLVWKVDESASLLLGYAFGNSILAGSDDLIHDSHSLMFRVHERELMEIVGRKWWQISNRSLAARTA